MDTVEEFKRNDGRRQNIDGVRLRIPKMTLTAYLTMSPTLLTTMTLDEFDDTIDDDFIISMDDSCMIADRF